MLTSEPTTASPGYPCHGRAFAVELADGTTLATPVVIADSSTFGQPHWPARLLYYARHLVRTRTRGMSSGSA